LRNPRSDRQLDRSLPATAPPARLLPGPCLRGLLAALALSVVAPSARAEAPPADALAEARAQFVHGTELVKKTQWAEALAAFEQSASRRPHAVTTFNIAVCERAIGRYTRARKMLLLALEQGGTAGRELPESLAVEAKTYLDEINRLLPRARVRLEPANADLAVDGRPLEALAPTASDTGAASRLVLVAGVRAPDRGEPPPSASFELLLDPGAHVITLSRKGFADAVVNRSFAPGSTTDLELYLDRLPATLHIASDRPNAIVTIDGTDVGATPASVSRPGGSYQIVVKKKGFTSYASQIVVRSGEELSLSARLPPEKPAITARWWFWTGAAVSVSGAVTATYFATRPDPQRPPLDGGGLGWNIDLR
jgi:hypothetical protein